MTDRVRLFAVTAEKTDLNKSLKQLLYFTSKDQLFTVSSYFGQNKDLYYYEFELPVSQVAKFITYMVHDSSDDDWYKAVKFELYMSIERRAL